MMTSLSASSYQDLARQLADGEVCAFVGAGLSVGAGLPGWYDLIAELAARIGYDLPPRRYANSETLIDAAQAYVNSEGLHSLVSQLKQRLDSTGVQPTAAHAALARLPISLVFTANYDNLLERAFQAAGKRVEVVVEDGSIPFMSKGPNRVNVVKLYGDLNQPRTLVLARQQYESYNLQRPQLVKLLETELSRSHTLYLGWSHTDPAFGFIFGELVARYGDMMRPGYAVMFDAPEATRRELARKHIRLVDLPAGEDRTARLVTWLQGLAPGGAAPAAAEATPAPIPTPAPTSSPAHEVDRAAELRALQQQLHTHQALLNALENEAILATGRERAALQVQINETGTAIRRVEGRLDELGAT